MGAENPLKFKAQTFFVRLEPILKTDEKPKHTLSKLMLLHGVEGIVRRAIICLEYK